MALKFRVCSTINYYAWVGDKRTIYSVKSKTSFIWRLIDHRLRANKLGTKRSVTLCGEERRVNPKNSRERGFILNDKSDSVPKFVWGKILPSEWLTVNIKLYSDLHVLHVSFKCFIWEYLPQWVSAKATLSYTCKGIHNPWL